MKRNSPQVIIVWEGEGLLAIHRDTIVKLGVEDFEFDAPKILSNPGGINFELASFYSLFEHAQWRAA